MRFDENSEIGELVEPIVAKELRSWNDFDFGTVPNSPIVMPEPLLNLSLCSRASLTSSKSVAPFEEEV